MTVGTVYGRRKIPLNTWLYCEPPALQQQERHFRPPVGPHVGRDLQNALGSWPTASAPPWRPSPALSPRLGGDGFVVEADEAYIGKKDGKAVSTRALAAMPISARS